MTSEVRVLRVYNNEYSTQPLFYDEAAITNLSVFSQYAVIDSGIWHTHDQLEALKREVAEKAFNAGWSCAEGEEGCANDFEDYYATALREGK